MKTRIQGGREAILILLFVAGFGHGVVAQWQIGEQVLSPPAFANYYSMGRGPDWPPLPFLPYDVPVYFLGTIAGTTNDAFAYDDRLLLSAEQASTQSTGNGLLMQEEETGGGSDDDTNGPPVSYAFDYGTNLFLLIGPLTNPQAWLVLTNAHNGTFYQLESRPQVNGVPWALGQIVQDTGTSNQVQFANVAAYYPSQTIFQGVGGNTVASIGLDPDWNLAVAPSTLGGTGQTGYFRIILSPPPGSGVTAVYQVSGSGSNGVHYTTLSGTVNVPSSGMVEIPVQPLYAAGALPDETVILTLVLTNRVSGEHQFGQCHDEDLPAPACRHGRGDTRFRVDKDERDFKHELELLRDAGVGQGGAAFGRHALCGGGGRGYRQRRAVEQQRYAQISHSYQSGCRDDSG